MRFFVNMRHLLVALLVLLVSPIVAASQVSTAFEKNVYFPDLTNKLETDSIYGSKEDQHLGSGMINLSPWVDTKYTKLLIGGLPGATDELSFVRSPNYNLDN